MIDYFEHIGAYKNGELSGDLLAAFEAEMAKDDELRKAVENHDVVEGMFDLMWEDEIRRVMKEGGDNSNDNENENQNENEKIATETANEQKTISIRKWLAVAASLVGLLVIGFLLNNQLNKMSGAELFAKHYSPFIDSNVTRGEEGIPVNLPSCDLGHYYMEEGKYEQASQIFKDDLGTGASECTEKSQWYLLLYNLKNENKTEWTNLLTVILENPNHTYYQKATKLQADLE